VRMDRKRLAEPTIREEAIASPLSCRNWTFARIRESSTITLIKPLRKTIPLLELSYNCYETGDSRTRSDQSHQRDSFLLTKVRYPSETMLV